MNVEIKDLVDTVGVLRVLEARQKACKNKSPGETLTAMNQALFDDFRALSSFVTVFCADWTR